MIPSYKPKTRLFLNAPLPGSGAIELDKGQTHYLVSVMRVKEGARVHLFNGRDGEWQAAVAAVTRKSVMLVIEEKLRDQSNEPDVWLCFAPIKKMRIDFIAQKATELGAAKLVPLLTNRTNAERVRTDRLYSNAVEAAEQCERITVPEVSEPIKMKTLLKDWPVERKILFCDEARTAAPILEALSEAKQADASANQWAIFIGPEGGFDESEREQLLQQAGCVAVSLGERILRADTAAMAALTVWQSTLGDW